MIPDALTAKEAAERIGISEQRIRTLLRNGAINGRQIGKQWLTTDSAVSAYLQEGGAKPPEDRKRKPGPLPRLKALSFFSGAMGLDLGLEKAGIHVLLACEVDKTCRRTITANRPEIALLGDVWKYDAQQIREAAGLGLDDEVDVMVGGPPCQAFSTAGARRGFHDERGNALLRYIELILEVRPRFAVIENVRGLLSAPMVHTPHSERDSDWTPDPEECAGGALMHVLSMLRSGGYGVSFNLYNAANFGVPQSRERVIIICSRDGERLPHLVPTHSENGSFGLPKWRTLRDALEGLDPITSDHEEFPEERLRFYRMLDAGQYWKHLPKHLHREALGGSLDSGGGKTGFLRRLAWDKPSCTLVTSPTMPATDICHPTEDRPLSVQEYARIQEFPDDWVFCGSLADRYKQIGNAVPVGLGEAVGRAILDHIDGRSKNPPVGFRFSRYKDTDDVSWEARTRIAMGLDNISGTTNAQPLVTTRTKPSRGKKKKLEEQQLALFSVETV
ncbi:DNA cytosine methyltransferase [Burkholderia cepacia]|uniref:DNA cytosine methyltransferase n=1 Tax=Burkholderia cepacia TaxID=292 RepID=UPI000F5F5C75|nr:DNA cytosine methyltransferase [Burkholderia cepacia]MCA7897636.1 DNA cytosine methyltransferase [Burkholderia cepacia]MCA7942208.1 DNA cytosine methyltransferase [Burkholderia cepacia]MDN7617874.1 DNA cytosine methyltransferase [Burkholderia cepacia]RQZ49628.1 DNA cytosine methyltransferase [Burkholderia cepacia]